eukprot:1142381-Pelagomonas_calceolata.AAC.4
MSSFYHTVLVEKDDFWLFLWGTAGGAFTTFFQVSIVCCPKENAKVIRLMGCAMMMMMMMMMVVVRDSLLISQWINAHACTVELEVSYSKDVVARRASLQQRRRSEESKLVLTLHQRSCKTFAGASGEAGTARE